MSDVKDWWHRITNCRSDVTPDHVLEAMHKAWKNATAPQLDLESTRVLTDTWDPAEPYPDEPGTHGPCYRNHTNIVCKCARCQPGVHKAGTG